MSVSKLSHPLYCEKKSFFTCNEISTLGLKLKFFLCLVLREIGFSENHQLCKIFGVKGFSIVMKGFCSLKQLLFLAHCKSIIACCVFWGQKCLNQS